MNDTDDKVININEYLEFDTDTCRFMLSDEAMDIIYTQRSVICSYSGADEWAHMFFCQLLDLYSGQSPYNYSLWTTDHKAILSELCTNGCRESAIRYIKTKIETDPDWFRAAADQFTSIIDSLPFWGEE